MSDTERMIWAAVFGQVAGQSTVEHAAQRATEAVLQLRAARLDIFSAAEFCRRLMVKSDDE